MYGAVQCWECKSFETALRNLVFTQSQPQANLSQYLCTYRAFFSNTSDSKDFETIPCLTYDFCQLTNKKK